MHIYDNSELWFFSLGKLEGKNTCVHFTFFIFYFLKKRSAGKLDRTRVRQERSTDQ